MKTRAKPKQTKRLKPRVVVLQIETVTDAPIKQLRQARQALLRIRGGCELVCDVAQIHASVQQGR